MIRSFNNNNNNNHCLDLNYVSEGITIFLSLSTWHLWPMIWPHQQPSWKIFVFHHDILATCLFSYSREISFLPTIGTFRPAHPRYRCPYFRSTAVTYRHGASWGFRDARKTMHGYQRSGHRNTIRCVEAESRIFLSYGTSDRPRPPVFGVSEYNL
jgi:hypothetical protein